MAKNEPMNDIVGREINIGDAAAFYYSSYRCLRAGRVTRFTRKKVGIAWTDNGHEHEHLAYPSDVALLPIEDYLFHALKK